MDSEVLHITSASSWLTWSLALAAGTILAFSFWRKQRFTAGWAELAGQLGLSVHGGFLADPVVSGVYRNRAVTLRSYIPCGCRASWTKLIVEVANPVRGSFLITRQGELERIGKRLGMLDLRVGDMAFDLHYMITARPAELAFELLGDRADLRRCMLEGDVFRLELTGNELICTHDRLEHDAEYLAMALTALNELADHLDLLAVSVPTGVFSFTEA
jgi:hypothetical protein